MLERYVAVVGGMTLPFLLLAALAVVLNPAVPQGWPRASRWRAGSVLVGLLAGTVFAILRATAVLTQRTMVNIPTLIACVIADALLMVVLALNVRRRSWGLEGRLAAVTNASACAALALAFFRAVPQTVLQLTAFIEPGESTFSSEMLMRLLGFLLGWAAIAVLAFTYYRASRRAPVWLTRLGVLTLGIMVLLFHLTELVATLHSVHRVQLNSTAFRVITWLTNNSQGVVLITAAALFLVPLAAAFLAALGRVPDQPNPARRRAVVSSRRRTRRWVMASAIGFAALVATRTIGVAKANEVPTLSDPEPYTLDDDLARLPIDILQDGHLHRYAYTASDGVEVRFIVVLKNGGAYGVGLDACENCGPSGYYEKDGKVICKRCDVAINPATIGFKGGCNPIPLDFDVDGGDLTIRVADLEAASKVFA